MRDGPKSPNCLGNTSSGRSNLPAMASQIMSQDIGHDPKEQSTRVAHHHDRFRRLHRAPRGNRAPVPGTCLRLPVAFATQTGADTHRQAADREDPDAPPCLCRRQTGASGLPRPIARQSRATRCRPLGNESSPRSPFATIHARSAAGTGAAVGFGVRPTPIRVRSGPPFLFCPISFPLTPPSGASDTPPRSKGAV